eukprot:1157588-Pelagomonas_calceolata.AAC.10
MSGNKNLHPCSADKHVDAALTDPLKLTLTSSCVRCKHKQSCAQMPMSLPFVLMKCFLTYLCLLCITLGLFQLLKLPVYVKKWVGRVNVNASLGSERVLETFSNTPTCASSLSLP